jgi:GNAT superfamily N-acetyltransferase/L-amino acid N-acyltransferase YncA
MEVRALRENEQDACVALWCTVWPGDNEAYFRRYFEGDVEWLPYYTQVAVDGVRIVSAVQVCKRTVACGDFRLHMGGIANVVTHPEYRGRGLNTACLRAAIGVMEADAMDFSLLFTGINGYYAREGFASIPRTRLRGTLSVDRAAEAPDRLTVRQARAEDLSEIFAIYDAYNSTRPIAVQRTPAYWRDWIGLTPEKLDSGEAPLVAVDPTGQIVGYVSYQVNFYQGHQITEDYAYVSEYGALERDSLDAGAEAALALLQAVAAGAMAAGKRELHLSIAQTPSIRSALRSICEKTSENVTESAMARLLDRENLLRSFLLEWNDRWNAAGRPSGEVVFDTPYGPTKLDGRGRFLKVEAIEGKQGALPHAVLLGLLFGAMTPGQATDDAAALPLLSALFPPQDGIYWSADGF